MASFEHMNSDEVRTKIHEKVNDIVALLEDQRSVIVTHFCLIMEGMDEEGNLGVWSAVNQGAACHQTLGLAEYMATREREHIAQHERHDHD